MPDYPIQIGDQALTQLTSWLEGASFSQLLVLDDTHTHQHCYPKLVPHLPAHAVHTVPAGEQHKHWQTCMDIWQAMTDLALDRKALVLNLGGGVMGDMGGFAAATYKRGLDFIQIPTTLLAMVDASVGGKLGIDFEGYKNHIGLYREPLGVYIFPPFLGTLPAEEVRSGLAEVIKHHLIADAAAWPQLRHQTDLHALALEPIIRHSVQIKADIVAADPQERGLRKALNFGHTIGHALETLRLASPHPLLHGEAIAVGMIAEAFLSQQRGLLSTEALADVTEYLRTIYPAVSLDEADIDPIIQLAYHDKKNEGGQILCTLLAGIGHAAVNQPIVPADIRAALRYYAQTG
jgi:3-dehydroquinate synthase